MIPLSATTVWKVRPDRNESSPGRVLGISSSGGTEDMTPRGGIPASIPHDQLYYWTGLWQGGVRVAREALERGDYIDFSSDDPNDIVRWLFDESEND